jgi:flagellar protein FlbD
MVKLTRLNGQEFIVNAELIQFLDATPETILTLTTLQKIVVKESLDEVIKKVVAYKKSTFPIVRTQED